MLNRIKTEKIKDHILTGHTRRYPEDASLCEAQRRAVKEVLDGKNEGDMPYEWYGGSAMYGVSLRTGAEKDRIQARQT